jgi:hypothetical protein
MPDLFHDVGAHTQPGEDEGDVARTLQCGRVIIVKAKTPKGLVDRRLVLQGAFAEEAEELRVRQQGESAGRPQVEDNSLAAAPRAALVSRRWGQTPAGPALGAGRPPARARCSRR